MKVKNTKSLFTTLALCIICLFVFSACNSDGESPKQAVSKSLSSVKSLDEAGMKNYFTYDELMNFGTSSGEESIKVKENTKLFFSKLDYKIISSSVSGKTATVKTEITNTDMKSLMGEYIAEVMKLSVGNAFTTDDKKLTDSDMSKKTDQMLIDMISKKDNKKETTTVNVKLSKTNKHWKIKMDKELQNAITGGLASVSSDDNKTDKSPKSKFDEINNFVIGDIWNKGFCDVSSYLNSGAGSTGESIDIDFLVSQLDNSYKKKKDYDIYIQGLDAAQFSNIKGIWNKLSAEIDALYNQIKSKKPAPKESGYTFDTGKFSQYMNAFGDAVDEIK